MKLASKGRMEDLVTRVSIKNGQCFQDARNDFREIPFRVSITRFRVRRQAR